MSWFSILHEKEMSNNFCKKNEVNNLPTLLWPGHSCQFNANRNPHFGVQWKRKFHSLHKVQLWCNTVVEHHICGAAQWWYSRKGKFTLHARRKQTYIESPCLPLVSIGPSSNTHGLIGPISTILIGQNGATLIDWWRY